MQITNISNSSINRHAFMFCSAILLAALHVVFNVPNASAFPHAPVSVIISSNAGSTVKAMPVLLTAADQSAASEQTPPAASEQTPPVASEQTPPVASEQTPPVASEQTPPVAEKDEYDELDKNAVADPIEPVNRIMFGFNDRLYFWVLKPVYSVYNAALPEEARIAGRNFFDNIAMPVRFVSCLVQLRVQCSAIELARFGINTTIGMAGLFDIAADDKIGLKPQDADMGLAMGHYGIKEGFYLVIPFLGPSSIRDGIGTVGDSFLTPTTYLTPWYVPYAISAGNNFNRGSLRGKDYEELIKAAIDPYTAVKDAYTQYRRGKIK
jgi:phospholipid-binding lipoprotein MlaA